MDEPPFSHHGPLLPIVVECDILFNCCEEICFLRRREEAHSSIAIDRCRFSSLGNMICEIYVILNAECLYFLN